jgi:molybdenum cofactor biosynthesis enzyme MoaA
MNKIICIGNGSANADQQARSIALKNNIIYHGILDVKTELTPGCYHTSVQDITLSYLLDKVADSNDFKFIVLDHDKNEYDLDSYRGTCELIDTLHNHYIVEFVNNDRKNLSIIDFKKNKSFCILPFIQLHVSETSDVKLCCISSDPIKKYTSGFDFQTDAEMEQIRQDMLQGQKTHYCKNCYSFEDGGADSPRTRDTKEWLQKLEINSIDDIKTNLISYDIRNDNLCNLACRMCNPQFSSQLEKEYQKIDLFWPTIPKSIGFNDIVDIDTVKHIYVAGGEPSLLPEFRKFLKRAVAAGRTDLDIRMNTNGTNLNTEFRDLLSKFSDPVITISLDGFDQVNKYIRWPSNWETIIATAKALTKITKNLSFNVTVSIWNISKLSSLIDFLDQEFPTTPILLNRLTEPKSQRFDTFPDKDVAIADLIKIKQSIHYQQDLSFRNKVDFYINELVSSDVDLVALKEFFSYNDKLDKSRNVALDDYIPELETCRALITKQI